MSQRPDATIVTHFSGLEDPRVHWRELHPLIDVVVIALSAIICGAEGWTDVELFGQAKGKWVAEFLDLSNGIPSHDTFGRVFAALDAEQFQACSASWVQALCEKLGGHVVVIDGKTLRRSHNRSIGREAIHMVTAWATESQLVLAQTQVDEKSNEITAIPAVPKLPDVMGCIVTIDAIGCQQEITAQIVEQSADYVLALKANQGTLQLTIRGKRLKAGSDEDYLTRGLCANQDAIALKRTLTSIPKHGMISSIRNLEFQMSISYSAGSRSRSRSRSRQKSSLARVSITKVSVSAYRVALARVRQLRLEYNLPGSLAALATVVGRDPRLVAAVS